MAVTQHPLGRTWGWAGKDRAKKSGRGGERSEEAWEEGTVTENGTSSPGPQPTTGEAVGGGPIEGLPLKDGKLGTKDGRPSLTVPMAVSSSLLEHY